MIQANSATLGTSLVTATGGSGGGSSTPGGGGGSGGVGRIRIESDTISGTTSPAASTAGTPGGSGGGSTKTFNAAGQDSYWYTDITYPTGAEDATIVAGAYTLHMYFDALPGASGWYGTGWGYRKKITILSAEVDANLTDFPVYVDLSDLGANFFSNVNANGGDIRITKADGTSELAREIVAIDTSGQTGEVHFKADSLSSSSNTDFYIYYGKASASDYAVSATYGRNNVWTANYVAVWHLNEDPSGSPPQEIDSTGNSNDGTSQGTLNLISDAQLGNGLDLDGIANGDWIDVPLGNGLDITGNKLTLSAWARTPAGGVDNDEALINKIGVSYPYMIGMQSSAGTQDRTNCRLATPNGSSRIEPEAVPRGSWVYLVCRYDGTNNQGFVNGSSVGIDPLTGNINAGTDVYLGRRAGDRRYEGDMDELRVSDIDRVNGWISTEYNNQSAPAAFYTVLSQETPPSVDITVSVYHTTSDGTGPPIPQEIVTSVLTTIDSSTPDPLDLDLGTDAIGQTFDESNPQRLRVQIHVDSVNTGGSFTLAYDSVADPSNLETPELVVPEYGLIFGAFAILIPVAMSGIWRRRRLAKRARSAHDPLAHSQTKSKQDFSGFRGAASR